MLLRSSTNQLLRISAEAAQPGCRELPALTSADWPDGGPALICSALAACETASAELLTDDLIPSQDFKTQQSNSLAAHFTIAA